jgi:hypothetical protein
MALAMAFALNGGSIAIAAGEQHLASIAPRTGPQQPRMEPVANCAEQAPHGAGAMLSTRARRIAKQEARRMALF